VPIAKSSPSSPDSQNWLARLYLAKGDLVHAREAFNRAYQLQPASTIALNGLVTLDIVEKKPEAARARLEARLASKPTDVAILFMAGNSYLALSDAARAEALFRKVVEVDPTNIDAYAKLGALYVSQNRLDEAKADFEEAARQQKKPVAAKTILGMILSLQNRHDEARKRYEEALALDPRAAVAANNLAYDYADRGERLDEALALAQTAKAQLPDSWATNDTLGWIYYKKGLASLAVSTLQQGAGQAPTNPTLHYHLGLAYLKNGDRKQARESLERALKLNPQFASADDAKRVLSTIKG
jgi:Flp pilus assembly protein TadD